MATGVVATRAEAVVRLLGCMAQGKGEVAEIAEPHGSTLGPAAAMPAEARSMRKTVSVQPSHRVVSMGDQPARSRSRLEVLVAQ